MIEKITYFLSQEPGLIDCKFLAKQDFLDLITKQIFMKFKHLD